MDLGKCPQCGAEWVRGSHACRGCGYIAIGADLPPYMSQRSRADVVARGGKERRYREPSGARPFLFFALVALVAVGLGVAKPWENDWEAARVLFMGEERTRSVAGDWEIAKMVITGSKPKGMLVPKDGRTGALSFTDEGRVRLNVTRSSGPIATDGSYALKGNRLTLLGFDKNVGNYTAGSQLAVRLVWTDTDSLMMKVGNEQILYLRRAEQGHKPGTIVTLDAQARSKR